MEINNLLNKIRHTDNSQEYFIALNISDDTVQVAIWTILSNKPKISSIGSIEYWSDDESIIEAVDKSLSNALEQIPEINDPTKLVFGLPSTWIEHNSVSEQKKQILKNICKKLELKPLGFVSLIDSLIHYLKIKEGVPTTAIVVHISSTDVTVSLVHLGNIISQPILTPRTEDTAKDLATALLQLPTQHPLPSRIIIFDGDQDLSYITQTLNSYDWKSQFSFLHLPQIEALPKDTAISAISIAGGAEVAKSLGFEIDFKSPNKDFDMNTDQQPVLEPLDEDDLSKLGFVMDKDIVPDALIHDKSKQNDSLSSQPSTTPKTNTHNPNHTANAHRSHTTAPQSKTTPIQGSEPKPSHPHSSNISAHTTHTTHTDHASTETPHLKTTPNRSIKMPKIALPKISIPKLKFPKRSSISKKPNKKLIVVLAFLVILVVALASATWFIPTSSITLNIKPKPINIDTQFVLYTDSTQTPSNSSNLIKATQINEKLSGSKTVETTGTGLVGERAKGEITIYNRTALPKTFKKGTKISYKNLRFTLNEDVKVASKSSGSDYTEIPGKATVKVTAVDIGDKYNLNAGTEFKIASFSKESYIAKNTNSFEGGSSEEVKVVSKDDIKTLKESLISDLKQQLMDKINSSSHNNEIATFIPNNAEKIINETYSAKVGDRADSITLDLELELTALQYLKKDVENLVIKSAQDSAPSGYRKTRSPISIKIDSFEQNKDGTITMNVSTEFLFMPEIDIEGMKNNIKGKSAFELKPIFEPIPGYKNAVVNMTPKWLPKTLKRIPLNPNNISITIKPLTQ